MRPPFEVLGAGLPTVLVHRGMSQVELRDVTQAVEELGYSTAWTGDHLLLGKPILEPVSTIAGLASAASRIRFGTGVLLAGLREPTRLIREVRTMVAVTGGRLVLGVGAGGDWPAEVTASGVRGRRGAALDRAIDDLRTELGGDCPALWVGGRSPAALRRAATRGDGWLGYLESPRTYDSKRSELMALADGCLPALVVLVAVVDRRRDADEAEHYMAVQFRGAIDALRRLAVIGPAEDVAARLNEFLRAGCRHLLLQPLTADPTRQFRLLAEQVAPMLAAA
ncbi:MAG: LLM class flavin-dependent oxidoreductase [Micromonosporaceae bacterium]|nr:LLM class flavin-dependent oxidoreductase [Micromonosporaceae bacterium]